MIAAMKMGSTVFCAVVALVCPASDVRDFGANGDGVADDTTAIQRAIDAGGTVHFPKGTYLSGCIYLKSDGGLDFAPGAVLKANPDLSKWPRRECLDKYASFARPDITNLHLVCGVGVGGGEIFHCSFSDIVMNNTRGGIWVCSRYNMNSRGVDISDVNFSDIHMDAICGIFIRHDYKFVTEPFTGVMRNIRFHNVSGTSRLPIVKVPNGVATMENDRFDSCDLVCGQESEVDPGELKFFQFAPL